MTDKNKSALKANHVTPAMVRFIVLLSAAIIGASIAYLLNYFVTKSIPTVEEVFAENISEEVMNLIQEDAATAGFYQYESEDGIYVMLSYGEVSGISMNVVPQISDNSVYFTVSGTDVVGADTEPVYRIYKTDASAISADELALKSPYYGVGTSGMNVGWVEATAEGNYYITPLMDTSPTDRVFLSNAEVKINDGLYYYEYLIQSSAAYLTAAEERDEYWLWTKVDEFLPDSATVDLLLGEENIRFQVSIAQLDDAQIELLTNAHERDTTVKLAIGKVNDTPAVITVNE